MKVYRAKVEVEIGGYILTESVAIFGKKEDAEAYIKDSKERVHLIHANNPQFYNAVFIPTLEELTVFDHYDRDEFVAKWIGK